LSSQGQKVLCTVTHCPATIDIWILHYYFGILNLYFNSKHYWVVLRVFSTSVIPINHFYK
jgi:hypothetical protein